VQKNYSWSSHQNILHNHIQQIIIPKHQTAAKVVNYINHMTNLLFLFLIALIIPPRVHAYLDPGTGSYVFQIILVSFLTVLYATKSKWKTFIDFLRKLLKRNDKADN